MRAAGTITAEQEREASEQSVRFLLARAPRQVNGAEYAVDFVLERLPTVIGDTRGDLLVETTIDPALQRRVQAIVRDHVLIEGATLDASQAAAVVINDKGGLLAVVGGRAYTESQFNRATRAKRQPGSTFKPFVYLAALENGLSPNSIISDDPITVGDWSPKNFSGNHKGALTLKEALAQSVNTAAVRLYLDIGRGKVVDAARRLGIQSELADNASVALGTSEVTPLELAAAYVPFSNGGISVTPYIIHRVRTADGKVLYEQRPEPPVRVAQAKHIAAMNEMLNFTMLHGTGKLAQVPGHQVGGKTGTSQDFRDAWFTGFSAHLTAVVWVGNDTARQMQKVVGGGLPAKIWREIMIAAHAGRRPKPLPGIALFARSAEVRTTGARLENVFPVQRTAANPLR
jgi:penicillin-binding protein 1A